MSVVKTVKTEEALPIFVVGSPRSGTTLIGHYVGSHPSVCYLGEYAGFFFSHYIAVREYFRVPTPYKEQYIHELQEHAKLFASKVALKQACLFYCDSTPWNLMIARQLVDRLPNAVFILTLRHYSGVLQSLERSYESGYEWAGATWSERAALWHRFYSNTRHLPRERVFALSYDGLCADPEGVIASLNTTLEKWGLSVSEFDRGQFVKSHATSSTHQRPTIGVRSKAGVVSFVSVPSIDSQRWDKAIEEEILPIVENTDNLLRRLFPDVYVKPYV